MSSNPAASATTSPTIATTPLTLQLPNITNPYSMEEGNTSSHRLRWSESDAPALHIQPYSYRQLLAFIACAILLILATPYLFFATTHPDSCYRTRPTDEMYHEEQLMEERHFNATGSFELPNIEAMEATPENGRIRQPTWYYQHQTLILIILLLGCLGTRILYAVWYMRPEVVANSLRASASQNSIIEISAVEPDLPEFDPLTTSPLMTPTHIVTAAEMEAKMAASLNASGRRFGAPKGSSRSTSRASSPPKTPPMVTRELSPMITTVQTISPHPHHQRHHSHHDVSSIFCFHWWSIFRMLYAYLWYLSAYFLCNALKSIIGDTSCSTHGNSVSGHYLFHCYAIWMIGYIHLNQKHLHGESMLTKDFWRRLINAQHLQPLDWLFLFMYPIYVGVCVTILCDTYFYGYHSLRQIIYGFTLAVIVFLAVTGVFEAVEDRISRFKGYIQAKGVATSNHSHSHPKNPTLSAAYIPFISGILYEWFYLDEKEQRFYTFPLCTIILFQFTSWFILACSPYPGFFHYADLGAVFVGYCALFWIWHNKLKLPKTLPIQRTNTYNSSYEDTQK